MAESRVQDSSTKRTSKATNAEARVIDPPKRKRHNLSSWDNYTHIRLIYVILSRYRRLQGKEMLFNGLEKYITHTASIDKKTFHLSMTYFWSQIVHFGIRKFPLGLQSPISEAPALPDHFSDQEASQTDPQSTLEPFSAFLLVNPHVADSNLWSEYYSNLKSVLMSSKAKSEMVLPNKKPLPSITIRDAKATFGNVSHNAKND
ncbi:hypothetical protein BJ165DRAFT_1400811 [Panaeolus papilionaceus]|nr:hypothetical protein BJ165DRAFT_1400811 [Panaeolus papilionaceus]